MGKKLSELDESLNIDRDDFLYVVNGSDSKKVKFGTMLNEVSCQVPELSNISSDSVNEGDYIELDIDNYDDEAT